MIASFYEDHGGWRRLAVTVKAHDTESVKAKKLLRNLRKNLCKESIETKYFKIISTKKKHLFTKF